MNIVNERRVVDKELSEQNIKTLSNQIKFGRHRTNNRKRTRGRRTQYIRCMSEEWPYKMYWKEIKHAAK